MEDLSNNLFSSIDETTTDTPQETENEVPDDNKYETICEEPLSQSESYLPNRINLDLPVDNRVHFGRVSVLQQAGICH